jgi:prophage tail gpP-like protein
VSDIRVDTARGTFRAFQSVTLAQDLLDVSTAAMTIGDDGSWRELERIVAPGEKFQISVDGRLQFTGRAEVNEVPVDADSGTVVELVCRTRMADARYASADPRIRFRDTSIKDFVLALYAPHGYAAEDFNFAPETDRNLMTGKKLGAANPVDLEPLKVDQAKVSPGETVFDCASRVLKRHHLMHWDAADGRINVGKPAVSAQPHYRFLCRRGAAAGGNNCEVLRRLLDWSEVPSELWAYGTSVGRDITKASLKGVSVDLDLLAVAARSGDFHRPVLLADDTVKTLVQANAHALRERQARSKRKDGWEITTDGWSQWDGAKLTPYVINTIADVDVETVAAGARGRYLCARVLRSHTADRPATTQISIVNPDTLEL